MTAFKPLVPYQIGVLIKAADARADREDAMAAQLRQDPDKAHFAWRFENASMWWDEWARTLKAHGEDGLDDQQRIALAYLVTETRIKRRKVSEPA